MALGLSGKKVLILSSNVYPAVSGDSVFSFGMVEDLSRNNTVDLATISPDAKSIPIGKIRVIQCAERLGRFNHLNRILTSATVSMTGRVKFLDSLDPHYDCVIIDHLRSLGLFRSLPSFVSYDAIYYVAHNVEYINQLQKMHFARNLKERLLAVMNTAIFWNERTIARKADAVFCLCAGDAYIYRNRFLVSSVNQATIYFPFATVERSSVCRRSLLFLGSLDWYPNRLGVLDFLRNCGDKLGDDWRFNIVGTCPPGALGSWGEDPRVQVHGFVDDLDPIFAEVTALVVPNRWGTGVKVKVYEALSKKVPVVVFRGGESGYEGECVEYLHVVDDWRELVNKLVSISNDV